MSESEQLPDTGEGLTAHLDGATCPDMVDNLQNVTASQVGNAFFADVRKHVGVEHANDRCTPIFALGQLDRVPMIECIANRFACGETGGFGLLRSALLGKSIQLGLSFSYSSSLDGFEVGTHVLDTLLVEARQFLGTCPGIGKAKAAVRALAIVGADLHGVALAVAGRIAKIDQPVPDGRDPDKQAAVPPDRRFAEPLAGVARSLVYLCVGYPCHLWLPIGCQLRLAASVSERTSVDKVLG